MEADSVQSLFPLIGGALALAGGVFTFVSGRLKDAEGIRAKERVIGLTLQWLSVSLNAFGLLAGLFLKGYAISVVFFSLAFLLQVLLFLRKSEPVRRIDVVTFSILCTSFGVFLVGVISLHFFGRLLDLMEKMIPLVR